MEIYEMVEYFRANYQDNITLITYDFNGHKTDFQNIEINLFNIKRMMDITLTLIFIQLYFIKY
jgi:hypothetical protein